MARDGGLHLTAGGARRAAGIPCRRHSGRRGQLEVDVGAEEGIRDLNQYAGAITGLGIGADGAAVRQPLEDL
jgi:hypothetical protein